MMQQLGKSFSAFNQNALASLAYIMTQNIWFLIIGISAIATILMMLKEELDYSVNEVHDVF